MGRIITLLRHEYQKDIKVQTGLAGSILFAATVVFIVSLAFREVKPPVWNLLFWIVYLFASTENMLRCFQDELGKRYEWYYQSVSAFEIVVVKILYHGLLLSLMGFFIYILFSFFLMDPVQNLGYFLLVLFITSFTIATQFSFISAIIHKVKHGSILMAVLGFPIIIPILLSSIRAGAVSLGMLNLESGWNELMIIGSICGIMAAATILLFHFLWKDV